MGAEMQYKLNRCCNPSEFYTSIYTHIYIKSDLTTCERKSCLQTYKLMQLVAHVYTHTQNKVHRLCPCPIQDKVPPPKKINK